MAIVLLAQACYSICMSRERIELLADAGRSMSFRWHGRIHRGLAIRRQWRTAARQYYEIVTDSGLVVVVYADLAAEVCRWYVESHA